MAGEAPLRLFVACPIPEQVKRGLASIQDDFRGAGFNGLRYVRPEGIHITLKFLGSVQADRVEAIASALENVIDPFELRLTVEGLGGFGGGRMAGRVIWASVRGEWERLASLAREVEQALVPLGLPPEARPFRPHLTLARMPQDMPVERRRELRRFLQSYKFASLPPIIVSEVLLIRSILGPGGSRYEHLVSFPAERAKGS